MSNWFRRMKKGITTPTQEKKETPDGLWFKSPSGNIIETSELKAHNYVVPADGFHKRIGSQEYFEILFDDETFEELDANLVSNDPLKFVDTKTYVDRVKTSKAKTGLSDAIRTAHGQVEGNGLVVCAMDFNFIGGSMGSVVGEKIARAIDYCVEHKLPLMIISKSGGARMMEAAFSLMQMAKTAAKLTQLAKHKLPYISYLTDPTTGGVTASFAMLGDINVAEPGALIGFAGPRVIKETIGKELPEGFQTSEFLLEHGFIDFIVDRRELKPTIGRVLRMFKN
ncbi:MAG: acetyl-CoA carboxylase carboxyltransferase subunit beta [Leptolyngbya sp. SIO3F4]|nr:acetyl-CoA carboxylase carboxyltransferase subunit beta [Leptolyngbya sp. SIO3F4]